MNYEETLKAMVQGKKVRRMSWNDGSYICFNSAGYIVDENGCLFPLFLKIAKSGDWEIYEESLKGPEMTAEHAIENLEENTEPEHKCNACHCNCSHTGADSDLQEKMKRTLKSKFFELAESTSESFAVNIMLDIYRLFYGE